MWFIRVVKGELSIQVLLKHSLLRNNLKKSRINSRLVRLSLVRDDNSLLITGEELGLLTPTGSLNSSEISVVDVGRDSNRLKVNGSRSSNNISRVNSLEWYAINLVWASNQKKSRLQLLQAYDSLPAESPRKKDQNITSSARLSNLRGSLGGLSRSLWLFDVISWVELGGLSGGGRGLWGGLEELLGGEREGGGGGVQG